MYVGLLLLAGGIGLGLGSDSDDGLVLVVLPLALVLRIPAWCCSEERYLEVTSSARSTGVTGRRLPRWGIL